MILALLVRYGTERYPSGTSEGIEAVRALAAGSPYEVVVLDNALSARRARAAKREQGAAVEPGDNRVREFTAWDAALARRLGALAPGDVVVLVTDALRQGDSGHLDDISPDAADLVAEWPVAYGHVDRWDEPLLLDGVHVRSWLRSSFVAMSARTLRMVTPLAAVSPADLFAAPGERAFGARVSGAYGEMIGGWLAGAETAAGTRYHAGAAQRSTEDFQVKAACIANEQLLSARLERAGVRLVDMTVWREDARALSR